MAYKMQQSEATIADAVSNAFSDLSSLAEECREIVDNAPPGLDQSQRIQTFDETAGQLESLNEPDVPEKFGDEKVTYVEQINKRRGPSRAVRCSNAVARLQAVVDHCGDWLEKFEEKRVAASDPPSNVTETDEKEEALASDSERDRRGRGLRVPLDVRMTTSVWVARQIAKLWIGGCSILALAFVFELLRANGEKVWAGVLAASLALAFLVIVETEPDETHR